MTLDELKKKGFIEVEDDISFRTHADVLRLFGKDQKLIQRAFVQHPHEIGVRIWFPVFYDDSNNDWINTFGLNEDLVFEKRKFDNQDYLEELSQRPEWHLRVLFAKLDRSGRINYKFKGLYNFDLERSRTANKAVYVRIEKKAKLYLV